MGLLGAYTPTRMGEVHPHVPTQRAPFPLIQYKGNYALSADHAWADSQLVTVSSDAGSVRYFVLYTGGTGYVSVFDREAKTWHPCDNKEDRMPADTKTHEPITFTVPLPQQNGGGSEPNTTSYTHILRNRHLLITKVKWRSSNAYPQIKFYAVDLLNKKSLQSYQVLQLFRRTSHDANIKCTLQKDPIAPNQFYINKIKQGGNEALVYGILQPGKKLSASFYFKPIEHRDYIRSSLLEHFTIEQVLSTLVINDAPYWIHEFSISAKKIHQTASQVLEIDGENVLFIPATVSTENDSIKLAMISVRDFKENKEEKIHSHAILLDLPPIHPNSDWQAMRTAVVKVGNHDHLILTLLSPEYQVLIFSYDPKTQKLSQLMNGPQLKFIDLDEFGKGNPSIKIQYNRFCFLDRAMDHHLLSARNKYPGFYPVRPIEIRVSPYLNGTSLLHIAYPTCDPGALNYKIHVASIPLSPNLDFKYIPRINPVQSVTAKEALPANHLALDICHTQLLLALPEASHNTAVDESTLGHSQESFQNSSQEFFQGSSQAGSQRSSQENYQEFSQADSQGNSHEPSQENSFKSVYSTCQKIQKLVNLEVSDLKTADTKELVNDEVKAMNNLIHQLDTMGHSLSNDGIKKIVSLLDDSYKVINTLTGMLKKIDITYSEGIGKNVDNLLGSLKEEKDHIKTTSHQVGTGSHHVSTGRSIKTLSTQGASSSSSMNTSFTQGASSSSSMSTSFTQGILSSNSISTLHTQGLFSDPFSLSTLRKKLEENINVLTKPRLAKPRSLNFSQPDELKHEALKWGLDYKEMSGDGNCFFHAIADQLHMRTRIQQETHITLREKAINYILNHLDDYRDFVVDLNKFINDNVQDRTWADNVMISALSRALNVSIVIVRSDHAAPTIFKQPKQKATLYIGYEVGLHYQSLIGKPRITATPTESRTLKSLIDKTAANNQQQVFKIH